MEKLIIDEPVTFSQNNYCFDIVLFKKNLNTKYLGQNFIYKTSTTSTMDDAVKEAENAPSGTLIFAEYQTKGKGRQNRIWSSSFKGNLYFTFLFRVRDVKSIFKFNFGCPLAVAMSLKTLGIKDVGVKWPNDVWVKDKKICGMLINNEFIGDITTLHCGIGINFFEDMSKNEIEEVRKTATSVSMELKDKEFKREDLLSTFCTCLEVILEKSFQEILQDYSKFDILMNKKVIVMPKKKEDAESYYTATAIGYDQDFGTLIVLNQDGKVVELMAEEVTIRPEELFK